MAETKSQPSSSGARVPAPPLAGFASDPPWDRQRLRIAIAILACVWLGLPLLCVSVWGVSVLEKFLTRMVLPAGLFFQFLLVLTLILFVRRDRLSGFTAVALAFFLVCSNPYVASSLMLSLERQYPPAKPVQFEPPLDAVVVLGGGLRVNRFENIEVGEDGQRAILAGQLYHAGKAEQIIATGSLIPGTSTHDISPAEAAERLLGSLGVPAEAFSRITGENTSDEMQSLRAWLDANPQVERYGLVTSAFHMPRAMRLARSQGLDPIPLPCCYRAEPRLLTILDVLPNAGALSTFSTAMTEYLAALVGR